jgi:subfamily B ATP-binding cassette protein MsbA
MIFSIFTVLFSLVSLVMLVPFLELLFDKTQLILTKPVFHLSKDYFVDLFYYNLSIQIQTYGKASALAYFCIIVCVVFLLKNLFRYLALFVLAPLRNQLIFDLRNQLYEKMLRLPTSFFQEEKKGSLITKFTSDLTEIEYSIMNTLETSIQSPLNVVLFLMAMFTISTPLTLFVFGMIIFMALFIGRIGKSLKKESKEGKEVLGKLTSIIDESISGIKIIQAYFVQDWIKNKFATENKNYYDVFNKMYRKRDLSSPLTEFLAIIVVCIVLWFGGQLVLAGGNLNPSNFIAFMVIFSQLIPPAKSFSSAFYEIKKGMASFERIQEILDAPDSDDSLLQRTQALTSFQKNIVFKNISFQYPNSQAFAINDFTFTFEKGKKYALVGASGAGKSTLFDLILQFIAPQKGQIEIDGKAIETMDLKNYRNLFGIVSQEAILFNYSVAENIAFEALEKQQISNALQISNAKEFVEKMNPETYYAIGERGSKLSGGEKQRLSISRVAYRNPEIILLDEATSALDSKNEQEVQSALKNLLADKTSIIIAHRLSTIKEVDCILVMQDGSIVEVGSHNELIAQNGTYAEMVSLQNLK